MKAKFFTLILFALVVAGVSAQRPEAVIKKASVAPVLDGIAEEVWAEADTHHISRPHGQEVPTLGNVGETYWQALWNDDGVYVFLTVTDDEFYPHYAAGGNHWEYDKPELYFDVNYILDDAAGPSAGGNGHHQIAPAFEDGKNDGTVIVEDNGAEHAFLVDGSNYTAEYFVPLTLLVDKDGIQVDLLETVGFDVTIIDRETGDAGRRRAVWSNTGTTAESWFNMDDCGYITFDGAEAGTFVDSVHVTGGNITENNGTLQMQAEVFPEEATIKTIAWSVENVSGRATIDQQTGVLTAILDGDVIVTAMAADGSFEEDTTLVNISNQVVTIKDINLIKNPYFDLVEADQTATNWGGWGGPSNAPMPKVVDGWAVCTPIKGGNDWEYQYNQNQLAPMPDVEYEFSFVAYADKDTVVPVVIEDANNDFAKFDSDDPRARFAGETNWDIPVTTTPTKYTLDATFPAGKLLQNTDARAQFNLGLMSILVYIDSVILVAVDDMALLTPHTEVTGITVTGEDGATSVSIGDTLQMSAAILPEDATYKDVKWSVVPGEIGWATIDENGQLTGDTAGVVTIIASAMDDSGIMGSLEVTVSNPTGIKQQVIQSVKLYPNPAVDVLNVILTSEEERVSVYNSLGAKIDEAIVTGGKHVFDVSSYAPGLYFVKTSDSVARFIK